MFTSLDKALVAALGSIVFFANMVWGINLFGEHAADVIEAIVAVLTPLLVWAIPNKRVITPIHYDSGGAR